MVVMLQRGFTLIELLVVMAIIGLLSSIIIASLNTSRSKGADAAIKEQLHALAQQAEIYYYNPAGGNGTYGATGTNSCTGGMFAADLNIKNGLLAISADNGAPVGDINGSKCAVPVGGAIYAMTAKLTTPGLLNPWWCIDSNGANKAEANSNFNGGLCN